MYLIITVVFLIDQALKLSVLSKMPLHSAFVLIPKLLEIRHQHNTGMAFSVLAGQPLIMKLVVTALVGLLTYIAWRIPRSRTLTRLAFAFILAGAYSNLLDRYVHGFVVDYINFLFVDFAVFNIADVALNIGAVLLLVDVLRKEPSAN